MDQLKNEMLAMNQRVKEQRDMMLEFSHSLGASGQAQYWMIWFAKVVEILLRMGCQREMLRETLETQYQSIKDQLEK